MKIGPCAMYAKIYQLNKYLQVRSIAAADSALLTSYFASKATDTAAPPKIAPSADGTTASIQHVPMMSGVEELQRKMGALSINTTMATVYFNGIYGSKNANFFRTPTIKN